MDGGTRGALVVTVPAAQGLLRRAADGLGVAPPSLPAHVTILYPWLRPDEVTDEDLGALADICGRVPAFDVVFDRFDVFPGVLWLAPDPVEPFLRLTGAVMRRWPGLPPYGGAHSRVSPHLSVVHLEALGVPAADGSTLGEAAARLAPFLPVAHRVTQVAYLMLDDDGVVSQLTVPLGDPVAPGSTSSRR